MMRDVLCWTGSFLWIYSTGDVAVIDGVCLCVNLYVATVTHHPSSLTFVIYCIVKYHIPNRLKTASSSSIGWKSQENEYLSDIAYFSLISRIMGTDNLGFEINLDDLADYTVR